MEQGLQIYTLFFHSIESVSMSEASMLFWFSPWCNSGYFSNSLDIIEKLTLTIKIFIWQIDAINIALLHHNITFAIFCRFTYIEGYKRLYFYRYCWFYISIMNLKGSTRFILSVSLSLCQLFRGFSWCRDGDSYPVHRLSQTWCISVVWDMFHVSTIICIMIYNAI